MSGCKNIVEFSKKYPKIYSSLIKTKSLNKLDSIRQIKHYTDDELIEVCTQITTYTNLINNYKSIYLLCYRRGLLEVATAHMKKRKTRAEFEKISDTDLTAITRQFIEENKITNKTKLCSLNWSLHEELKSRNMLKDVLFIENPEKQSVKSKLLQMASAYKTYDDFVKDSSLFKKCKNNKIIKKVQELFPKLNPRELIKTNSQKYKSFEEFSKTEWYAKSKRHKGLIQEIKCENGWDFFIKGKKDYVISHPDVVEMLNKNVSCAEISRTLKVNINLINRVKKQMKSNKYHI